ncbi:MAG: LAGLIDADG family homing endonuclease [Nanoarchaeota archaeon]|nr:LAGLIDADG family homing endonuclease [Nanoarchaeota archaeon]
MRIKIRDENIRKYFFELVKEKNSGLWKNVRKEYKTPRATFDKYRTGKLFIPEELFFKLFQDLNAKEKAYIMSSIEKFPDNFGNVLGGKKAYSINFDKFKEGRIKGAQTMNKKRDNLTPINFDKIYLDKEICEFVGAFIGDGCFNKYKNKVYHIEFAGDKRYDLPYYKEKIIPIIRNFIPKIKPHFYISNRRENAVRIVFYSKELFIFLSDFIGFIPGKKTHTVKIPDKIMLSNDSLVRATIRGIFDTDGGVFLDKRKVYKKVYPRIIFSTVSKPLYEQLNQYLSKNFKIYRRFNEKRHIYIIEIYGINQMKRWMSLIGFSNKRHLIKINQLPE